MNHCNTAAHKHGKDRHGNQRYRCPICGKTFTDNPNPGKAGRPLLGDRAMTDAERKRRQRNSEKGNS